MRPSPSDRGSERHAPLRTGTRDTGPGTQAGIRTCPERNKGIEYLGFDALGPTDPLFRSCLAARLFVSDLILLSCSVSARVYWPLLLLSMPFIMYDPDVAFNDADDDGEHAFPFRARTRAVVTGGSPSLQTACRRSWTTPSPR